MRIANTTISVEEYLSSVYEPECDYVDGQLEDRNAGEKDHSKLQFRIQMLLSRIPGHLQIFPAVRIRVSPTRFKDRWSRMTQKLDDYSLMGCPNIWVLESGAVLEVHDALATTDPSVTIQLLEIWQ